MTTPKAILVVGPEGLERVHLLHRKGQAEAAVAFYERLVPALSSIDERAQQREPMNHANKPQTPKRS